MTTPLPTPRSFLTSLFNQLETIQTASPRNAPSNPLETASPETQNLFLTLHCLFPNEFLPALDVLDRQLITRFVIGSNEASNSDGEPVPIDPRRAVYYVRSSQPVRGSRYSGLGGTSYEVRLKAWNCSCPAFTFAAFAGLAAVDSQGGESGGGDARVGNGEVEERWRFGGTMRGEGRMPVCKHLLACVMVEKCGFLEHCVEEKVITREEAAGWAAGWGG